MLHTMVYDQYFNHCPFFDTFCTCADPSPPPTPQPQQPVPLDAVDHRDLDDFGINPDGPDLLDLPCPDCVDLDMVLASLIKGLPEFDAEEMDQLLKQLPMPSPGQILCYIPVPTCNISC